MKTFRWTRVLYTDYVFVTLFDVTKENENIVQACGTVVGDGELFKPLVTNPYTQEKLTINELLSFKEAKEAVEKKLFDDGVIADGDLVEDSTE